MIKEHKDLPSLDDNTVLWRYMPLEKFLYLIRERKLYFCRLDAFEDKHEGRLSLLDKKIFHYNETSAAYWERETKRHFANCWIQSPHELNLMWNNYGKGGIAIQTTVKSLKQSLEHDKDHMVYLSYIKYIDDQTESSHEPSEVINIFRILYSKRKFFEQEREVRLLYSPDAPKEDEKGYPLDVDLKKLIEKVVLSPSSDTYLETIVKQELTTHDITATTIIRSEI